MKHIINIDKTVLQISDLKDNDYVGFQVNFNERGFVVADTEMGFFGVIIDGHDVYRPNKCLGVIKHESLKDAIEKHCSEHFISELYKFDTSKELYEWLAS